MVRYHNAGTQKFDGIESDSVNAGDLSNIIYASENIAGLPSIQEAMSEISIDDKSEIHIVGGRNEISQTITAPSFTWDDEIDRVRRLTLVCRGDAYLQQADGANLEALIRAPNGSHISADVQIDGNKANNSTDVTGVQIRNTGNNNEVTGHIVNCDVGVDIVNESEDNAVDVWFGYCGIGVRERSTDTGLTPDQNRIEIRGHGNDGPYYKKTSGSNSKVRIDAEGLSGGPAVVLESGATSLEGSLRGVEDTGVLVDGASYAGLNGLNLNALGGTATGVKAVSTPTNGVVNIDDCHISGSSNIDTYGVVSEVPITIDNSRISHFDVGVDLRAGSEGSHIRPGAEISNVQTEVANPEKASGSVFLTPSFETTVSLASGEVKSGYGTVDTSRPHLVMAIPNNDPGNDHGYQAWSFTRSDGAGRLAIEEKMNSGGGEARLKLFYLDSY